MQASRKPLRTIIPLLEQKTFIHAEKACRTRTTAVQIIFCFIDKINKLCTFKIQAGISIFCFLSKQPFPLGIPPLQNKSNQNKTKQ